MTDPGAIPATDVPTDAPEDNPKVVSSILGSLRESRAKIGAGSDPLYLDVPGYDGKLVVRYKWIPFRDLTRTGQQLSKITEPSAQAVAAAADTVVAACDEVCVRVIEDSEDLQPLATDGIPVTFSDPRLAYALNFDAPKSARDMATRVFNNEYALIDQASEVVEWLKDTTKKVDSTFLGE